MFSDNCMHASEVDSRREGNRRWFSAELRCARAWLADSACRAPRLGVSRAAAGSWRMADRCRKGRKSISSVVSRNLVNGVAVEWPRRWGVGSCGERSYATHDLTPPVSRLQQFGYAQTTSTLACAASCPGSKCSSCAIGTPSRWPQDRAAREGGLQARVTGGRHRGRGHYAPSAHGETGYLRESCSHVAVPQSQANLRA